MPSVVRVVVAAVVAVAVAVVAIIIGGAVLPGNVSAQSAAAPPAPPPLACAEDAAILAVVDQFMIGISTNDSALLARIRFENSLNIVDRPAQPPATGTVVTRRPFNPEGSKPGNFKERYWDPTVHVRGRLAIVWTPYEFWRDGKTSHCGIDVFELVKEQDTWKIGNAMWTVEPDACPALRPSDPSRIRPRP